MNKLLNAISIFLFVWEKDRYYSEPAARGPQKITQEYWDEMQETFKYYNQPRKDGLFSLDGWFIGVDTTSGTMRPDFQEKLGPRPKVPTSIKELRRFLFITGSFICLIIDIYILKTH